LSLTRVSQSVQGDERRDWKVLQVL
jgi:hypothetical protein